MSPFRSSAYELLVYTISRCSKTHSVDSLLQHTSKHHQVFIALSGNIIICRGTMLHDTGSLSMTFDGSSTEK